VTPPIRCRVEAGSAALADDFRDLAEHADGWHAQGCARCGGSCFPPRLRCPTCGGDELRWEPIGRSGVLVSVVLVAGDNQRHRPPRALRGESYATGIVVPDRLPDVRFPTLLLGEDAHAAQVGDVVSIGNAQVAGRLTPIAHVLRGNSRRSQ
jgi:uncharacterized OB-fold protein